MSRSLVIGSVRRFGGLQSRNLHTSFIIANTLIRPSSYHYPLFSSAVLNRSATNWATKSTFDPEKLTEDSWAAPRLEEVGVKLLPSEFVEAEEFVELTEEMIHSATPRVEYLAKEILALNELERMEFQTGLMKRLSYTEETFANLRGGGGQTAGSSAGGATADTAVKEEKTTFDIKIGLVDAKVKIKVIKEVRSITGLGLKEAKELVEKAPTVLKQGVKKEEAENFKKLLTDAGADVTLE